MDLSNYVDGQELLAETEFPEEGSGFFVTVRHLSPKELRSLTGEAACQAVVIKGGRARPLDEAKGQAVIEAGMARLIHSWRGLTPEMAASLIPGLQVKKITADLAAQGLTEIPCEDENKLFLIRKAHGFIGHIERTAKEAELFRAREQEEETKNS